MSALKLESIKVASEKELERLNRKHLENGTRAVELSISLRESLDFGKLGRHDCIVKDCWQDQEYGFWTCRDHRHIEVAIRGTTESARYHEHILLCEPEVSEQPKETA